VRAQRTISTLYGSDDRHAAGVDVVAMAGHRAGSCDPAGVGFAKGGSGTVALPLPTNCQPFGLGVRSARVRRASG
jgi:hypothetical protein